MDSKHSSRYLALRLPHLLAQVEMGLNPALREQAFVVATGHEPRSQVLGLSPALGAVGPPGEALAVWLRRHPQLLVVEGRPERAQALLERVRLRLQALLPDLREEGRAAFLLNLRGSALLHPQEGQLARRLLKELQADGVLGAVGIGSSPLAAHLLCRRARAGEWHAVEGEAERSLLEAFPLAGLPELSGALLRSLGDVGVRTVGEARALDPIHLQRLHGTAALRLLALLQELDSAADGASAEPALWARRRLAADSADPQVLEALLLELLEVVHGRSREEVRAPDSLELRLQWNDGLRQRRQARIHPRPGESRRQSLRRTGRKLLQEALEARRLRVREVELRLETRAERGQLGLFDAGPEAGAQRPLAREPEGREGRLDQALLQLRRRWGPRSVTLGPGALAPSRPGPRAA